MKDYPKICSKEEASVLKLEMDNRIKDAVSLFEMESGYTVEDIILKHVILEDKHAKRVKLISSKASFHVEID